MSGRPAPAEAEVDAVFGALADGTRRAVLRAVVDRGPVTATAIAADLPVSRQAVAKHLAVLGDAGLVRAVRAGRESRYEAAPAALAPAREWMVLTDRAWHDRLDRLRRRAEQGPA